MGQLVLAIRLDDHAVFETFHPQGNESACAQLSDLAAGLHVDGAWVSGPAASGKTHLLQATCERAGSDAVFLSSEVLRQAGPDMLQGLESRRLVVIDDIDALLGDPDWEAALFDLYNQLADHDGCLVVSAAAAQRESGTQLPDLASRFSRLPGFRLNNLDEEGCKAALKLRASHRGFDLPDETLQYLLSRSRRDMRSLYELLDHLDLEALRAKRRLTIPFVREVLLKTEESRESS